MKGLINVLFLFSFGAAAQVHKLPCPLDSNSKIALHFDFLVNSDSVFSVRSYVSDFEEDMGREYTLRCERFLFDWETYAVSNAQGEEDFICSPKQIVKLSISTANYLCPECQFDLDSYEMLTSLRLPALKEIEVRGQKCKIRFGEWEAYNGLLESLSLESIRMEAGIINEDWIDPFLRFENLKVLATNNYLSSNLVTAFPHLEELTFWEMYYHFSHYIVEFNNLQKMPTMIESQRSTDLYPQVTFFSNKIPPNIEGHPFKNYHTAIQEKLRLDSLFSGVMVITYGDALPNYVGSIAEHDTVAFGNVVSGKAQGVWKFLIPDFNAFEGGFFYLYDYADNDRASFPKDGVWEYNYPNGGLAISGQFRNGLKDGEWKFYNPDSFLSMVKNYREGKSSGLSIERRIYNSEIEEIRRYFLSPNYAIYGVKMGSGRYRVSDYYQLQSNPETGYYLQASGNLWDLDNKTVPSLVPQKSRRYRKVVKSYIKKLYPDIKISLNDLSFDSL